MRLPERAVNRVHVPVPRWIVGFFDPAQAYMERSRRRPPSARHRRRPARGWAAYAPLTANGRLTPTWAKSVPIVPPPEVQERLRRRANEHAVRRDELLASLGAPLDHAARQLYEQGTTVIAAPAGTLSARMIRFRWGDRVLEIDLRGGSSAEVTAGSRTRLTRQQAKDQPEVLKRYLADALADLDVDS